jgi:hypothetical protein
MKTAIFAFVAFLSLGMALAAIGSSFGFFILSFLLPFTLSVALMWKLASRIRDAWAFLAPERARLTTAIARSATDGPMASGLAPIAALVALMFLILFANSGARP